jgi:hypothetical protein
MPFPKKTALERLLVTERHRRRTDESTQVGFAVPAFTERPVDPEVEPLVVTDARGQLVSTKVSRSRGVARCGFFECTTKEEATLVPSFFDALWALSEKRGWRNRCSSLAEASKSMHLEPRSIVVPYGWIERASGMAREDADRLMSTQGYISKDDQQVLVGDLAEGCAIIAAAPPLLGFYIRVDDRLGVMLTRVDQSIFLVRGAT